MQGVKFDLGKPCLIYVNAVCLRSTLPGYLITWLDLKVVSSNTLDPEQQGLLRPLS